MGFAPSASLDREGFLTRPNGNIEGVLVGLYALTQLIDGLSSGPAFWIGAFVRTPWLLLKVLPFLLLVRVADSRPGPALGIGLGLALGQLLSSWFLDAATWSILNIDNRLHHATTTISCGVVLLLCLVLWRRGARTSADASLLARVVVAASTVVLVSAAPFSVLIVTGLFAAVTRRPWH